MTPELEERISAWTRNRAVPEPHLSRWVGLDEPSAARLLEIAQKLKFRRGQFIAAFTLLEEIALREQKTVVSLLADPALQRIISGPGSGPGRARELLDDLQRLRYPQLKKTRERLKAAIAALGLPADVRVVLPRELASDELRIELVARSGSELRGLLRVLNDKADGLARIAELLGGADEV